MTTNDTGTIEPGVTLWVPAGADLDRARPYRLKVATVVALDAADVIYVSGHLEHADGSMSRRLDDERRASLRAALVEVVYPCVDCGRHDRVDLMPEGNGEVSAHCGWCGAEYLAVEMNRAG